MAYPTGEAKLEPLRVNFDRRLKLEFHGSRVTSDAGLVPYRDLDDALGLTELGGAVLSETRFGVNSGIMTVGNVGAERRFAYTVMGDAVNLAARLEGANKQLGTTILVGEETHRRCRSAFDWREVNRIRVVGRETPVRVWEPIDVIGRADTGQRQIVMRYEQALERLRSSSFDDAQTILRDTILARDACARSLVRLIPELKSEGGACVWDGTVDPQEK